MTPARPVSTAARVVLLALLAVAAWLRLTRLALAPTAEEVSDVYHGGPWLILANPEMGVNPPLLKLVFNGLFECGPTITAGRVLSVVCGVGAVAVGAALARRLAGGDDRAAVFAAAVLALHPYAVQVGAEFRAYAPLSLALVAQLWALVAYTQASDDRERGIAARWVTLTAVLTAQLHYLGFAVILALALQAWLTPALRRLARGYALAAVLMAPWVVVALARPEIRRIDTHSIGATITRLLSTGLRTPGPVLVPWDVLLQPTLPGSSYDIFPMAVFLGLAACLAWASAAGREPRARPVWIALVASLIAMPVFSLLHHVRTPATVLYLVPAAVLWPLAPLLLRSWWAQNAAYAVFVTLLGASAVKLGIRPETYGGGQRAVELAAQWHELDAAREGGPVWVYPAGGVVTLWFIYEGHAWDINPTEGSCDLERPCFVRDGVQIRGLVGKPEDTKTGVIVASDHVPEDFAAGCTRVSGTTLDAWTCR